MIINGLTEEQRKLLNRNTHSRHAARGRHYDDCPQCAKKQKATERAIKKAEKAKAKVRPVYQVITPLAPDAPKPTDPRHEVLEDASGKSVTCLHLHQTLETARQCEGPGARIVWGDREGIRYGYGSRYDVPATHPAECGPDCGLCQRLHQIGQCITNCLVCEAAAIEEHDGGQS
jgi:hypothetical protein